MKFKGYYSSGDSYDVGDVVIFDDGGEVVYGLQHECAVGTPPTNSLYWGRVGQPMSQAILFMRDAMDLCADPINANIATVSNRLDSFFIDEKTLLLASSSDESDKVYALTVEDGDSGGELVISEVEEASDGGEATPEGGDT